MPSPSRRALLAACPTVAAFVALGATAAHAMPTGPLHAAITANKAARAALDHWSATTDDDLPRHLLQAEWDSLDEIVAAPCQSDAEFVAKVRGLAERQAWLNGHDWTEHDAEPLLKAVARHFNIATEA